MRCCDSSGRKTGAYPFWGRRAAIRRKPGTDTKFPARFAGNWLSVPGFAPRETLRLAVSPKTVKHPPNSAFKCPVVKRVMPTFQVETPQRRYAAIVEIGRHV